MVAANLKTWTNAWLTPSRTGSYGPCKYCGKHEDRLGDMWRCGHVRTIWDLWLQDPLVSFKQFMSLEDCSSIDANCLHQSDEKISAWMNTMVVRYLLFKLYNRHRYIPAKPRLSVAIAFCHRVHAELYMDHVAIGPPPFCLSTKLEAMNL